MENQFKRQLVSKLHELLDAKIKEVEGSLKALDESGEGETKSSAGDKYETSREMMNQERGKFEQVLWELRGQESLLSSIELGKNSDVVGFGSVVELTGMILFISIPFGQVKVGEKVVFAVSLKSPVAQSVIGKRTGDKIELNKKVLEIKGLF